MWIKTIYTQFRKKKVAVAALIDSQDNDVNNVESRDFHVVKIKSCFDGFNLEQQIWFNDTVDSEAFIESFNNQQAYSFLVSKMDEIGC